MLLQTVIPAVVVFSIFIVGHLFISNNGSGIYLPEADFDVETALEEPQE